MVALKLKVGSSPMHKGGLLWPGLACWGPLCAQGLPLRITYPCLVLCTQAVGHQVPTSSRSSLGEEGPGYFLTAGPQGWAQPPFVALPMLRKSGTEKCVLGKTGEPQSTFL